MPPENVDILEATKVNFEIWKQIALQTKSLDKKKKKWKKLILKSLSLLSKVENNLYKQSSEIDLTELASLFKVAIWKRALTDQFFRQGKWRYLHTWEKFKKKLNLNY